jgi:hypothetical protein
MSRLNCAAAISLALTFALGTLHSGVASAEDKGIQATIDQRIEAVQKAAVNALTVIGCTIKKEEAAYVEGRRDRKIGAFVGSGGETVKVTLTAAGEGKTSIDIRTKKTFVGMAGQKNWDQPVLDEITKALAPTAPAPSATPAAPATAPGT